MPKRILLTTTSFQDTPGAHHDVLTKSGYEIVRGRGPFSEEGELALMRAHAIDVLVSRDSGGPQTAAKLTAARRLGIPVVMVDRPPAATAPTVTTAEAAAEWLAQASGLSLPEMTP